MAKVATKKRIARTRAKSAGRKLPKEAEEFKFKPGERRVGRAKGTPNVMTRVLKDARLR
jgi:hypothetical protein